MKQTTFEEFVDLARRGTFVPVVREIMADLLTPVSAFLKIAEHSDYAFLFESVEGGEQVARYSFLGKDPFLVLRARGSRTSIDRSGVTTESDEPFVAVTAPADGGVPSRRSSRGCRASPAARSASSATTPAPSSSRRCRRPGSRRAGPATAATGRRCRVHAVRHGAGVRSRQAPDPDHRQRPRHRRRGSRRAVPVRLREDRLPRARARARPVAAGAHVGARAGRLVEPDEGTVRGRRARDQGAHRAPATSTRPCCRSGSRPTSPPIRSPSTARCATSTRRRTCISCGWGSWRSSARARRCWCASKAGRVETHPIAGTRPRGANDEEDLRLAEELKRNEKERAEHVMLVDLGRNDLGRVCEFGSVRVPQYMALERYSHVMHLVSTVEGTLAEDHDHLDALVACFPAGTVSGAPKIRAMQILAELEPTRRDIYAGAVGYIDFAGNLDFCIAIRTITIRNGRARVQAGAGIVADSNPAAEYEETRDKARALLQALAMAEAGL